MLGRVWITDRGMASADNLAWLRQTGRRYIIGAPKSELKKFAPELAGPDGWRMVHEGVEVKLTRHSETGETVILCRSADRRSKERAMHDKFSPRIEEALGRLAARLARSKKRIDPATVNRHIGRILQQNQRSAARFAITLEPDGCPAGFRLGVVYNDAFDMGAALSEGAYLLRSNICDWSDRQPPGRPVSSSRRPKPLFVSRSTNSTSVQSGISAKIACRLISSSVRGVADACCVAFSPDGYYVAFERRGDLWVVEHDGTELHRVARSVVRWEWAPDGQALAIVRKASPDGTGGAGIEFVGAEDPGIRETQLPITASSTWHGPGSAVASPSPRSRRTTRAGARRARRLSCSCSRSPGRTARTAPRCAPRPRCPSPSSIPRQRRARCWRAGRRTSRTSHSGPRPGTAPVSASSHRGRRHHADRGHPRTPVVGAVVEERRPPARRRRNRVRIRRATSPPAVHERDGLPAHRGGRRGGRRPGVVALRRDGLRADRSS